MNLLTAAAFSRLAGVSEKTISIALNPKDGKEPRLDYCSGSRKIDTASVKARAFLNDINPSRGGLSARVPGVDCVTPETGEDLTQALINTQEAQSQKIIETAELTKQKRIEAEMKNAVRRGELIEFQIVNQMIMTWFDRWLQNNKRGFNGSFDEFLREAFKVFENDQSEGEKDFKMHPVTRSTLKRKWADSFEAWADDGKRASVKKLEQIQIAQAKMK